jgi:hypothetical protein
VLYQGDKVLQIDDCTVKIVYGRRYGIDSSLNEI